MTETNQRTPRFAPRDLVGIALFALGTFVAASLFQGLRQGLEGGNVTTRSVSGLAGLLGVWPGLIVGLALVALGGFLFVSPRRVVAGPLAAGFAAAAAGLALLFGALSGGAAGGALGSLVVSADSGLALLALGVVISLIVLAAGFYGVAKGFGTDLVAKLRRGADVGTVDSGDAPAPSALRRLAAKGGSPSQRAAARATRDDLEAVPAPAVSSPAVPAQAGGRRSPAGAAGAMGTGGAGNPPLATPNTSAAPAGTDRSTDSTVRPMGSAATTTDKTRATSSLEATAPDLARAHPHAGGGPVRSGDSAGADLGAFGVRPLGGAAAAEAEARAASARQLELTDAETSSSGAGSPGAAQPDAIEVASDEGSVGGVRPMRVKPETATLAEQRAATAAEERAAGSAATVSSAAGSPATEAEPEGLAMGAAALPDAEDEVDDDDEESWDEVDEALAATEDDDALEDGALEDGDEEEWEDDEAVAEAADDSEEDEEDEEDEDDEEEEEASAEDEDDEEWEYEEDDVDVAAEAEEVEAGEDDEEWEEDEVAAEADDVEGDDLDEEEEDEDDDGDDVVAESDEAEDDALEDDALEADVVAAQAAPDPGSADDVTAAETTAAGSVPEAVVAEVDAGHVGTHDAGGPSQRELFSELDGGSTDSAKTAGDGGAKSEVTAAQKAPAKKATAEPAEAEAAAEPAPEPAAEAPTAKKAPTAETAKAAKSAKAAKTATAKKTATKQKTEAPEPDTDDVVLEPAPRGDLPTPPLDVADDHERLVYEAGCLFLDEGRVAVSMLQKHFELDFKASTAVLDELQQRGLIGPYLGGKRRDILIGKEEWAAQAAGQSA